LAFHTLQIPLISYTSSISAAKTVFLRRSHVLFCIIKNRGKREYLVLSSLDKKAKMPAIATFNTTMGSFKVGSAGVCIKSEYPILGFAVLGKSYVAIA